MGKNSIPSWEVSEFVEYIRVRGRHDPAGAGRRVGSKAGQRRGDPAAAKRDPARVLHHHLRAAALTCAQGETSRSTRSSAFFPYRRCTPAAAGTLTAGRSRPGIAICGSPSTTPATRTIPRAPPYRLHRHLAKLLVHLRS
jgi:hypothetical protein